MTICYVIGNAIYLNVTNRCTNRCKFCVRDTEGGIAEGLDLWLEREPTVAEIVEELKTFAVQRYDEIVFCGYGEPFMRFDDCRELAERIKESYHIRIRVNTNGHANRIMNRDVTPEMVGLFDEVSISLNEKDAERYNELCRCVYGPEGFDEMLDFARRCVKNGIHVVMSAVDVISAEDAEECRRIAEDVGAEFRLRKMIGTMGGSNEEKHLG